jgi:hypothetical protein
VHDAFTYVTTTRDADPRPAIKDAGGVVVGAWIGARGIGWWDDDLVVLAGWPGGTHGDVAGERLRATARPTAIEPLERGGVFAHRWFETMADTWDEFLDLSTGAWPAFEAAYGATIHGFFRSEDAALPEARALLITRYPSLAAWEESRAAPRSKERDVAESGARFVRRWDLTKRSIVRVGTLL